MMIRNQGGTLTLANSTFKAVLFTLLQTFAPTLCEAQSVQYLSPVPGSTMVSAKTNIIVGMNKRLTDPGAAGSSVFSVRGSVSGTHNGRSILSDDKHTIIFQPDSPFSPGEVVSVALNLNNVTRDGGISLPGFSFSVSSLTEADQANLMKEAVRISSRDENRAGSSASPPPFRLNKTQNDTLPSDFSRMVVVQNSNPSPGDIFLGTFKLDVSGDGVHASLVPSDDQYLLILSSDGTPVFGRKTAKIATDFKLQPNGKLTYFDGGTNTFYELDTAYSVVDSFACGNGYQTDNHELLILPNGHALLLGLDAEIVDMRRYVVGGYPFATVIGNVIQELDQDRNVVFQWRTFDHFQVTDATHENLLAQAIDYVHANALDVDSDGNILMSSRHLDEITKIDRQTGGIIWRWGGKNNQFTFTNDPVGFSHQHSIRRTPSGTLIMFDDGDFNVPRVSRAVEYTLDEESKSATLSWQFRHSPDVYAAAMGSVQRLPNGNTFIGWGTTSPAVTEVVADGTVVYELQLPDSIMSYRAFRYPWKPASVVTNVRNGVDVPTSFALAQNYPNPFNPSTRIQYSVPRQSDVRLRVYDMIGREIATLVDESKPAGTYMVRFDASRLASGVYCYRLTTAGQTLTRLMMLMK
jgi:hypothetical protein